MLVLAFLIGCVAGLRTMTAPAAVSWAAHLGWLLGGTGLAFLGATVTPWLLTLAAVAELIADQLPRTPSRKVPVQFGARIVSGALCGAAFGIAGGSIGVGLVAGIFGAVAGTLAGAELRSRLARAFGRDLPAALLEDAVAIGGALWIVASA
ncbi:membrane protein [Inquilinus limosus]|uniref:Membrane protein n=1 Tax=Inquilinus limosus MP06 TaxID=1398085 RepID=A0A0A0D1Z2_9PROT|nr:membrane protein [Inquilinus limosus]KGM32030.1 membrane protein [Inquilinus limosus MP06]